MKIRTDPDRSKTSGNAFDIKLLNMDISTYVVLRLWSSLLDFRPQHALHKVPNIDRYLALLLPLHTVLVVLSILMCKFLDAASVCTLVCARALASAFLPSNSCRRRPASHLAFPPLNTAWIRVAAPGWPSDADAAAAAATAVAFMSRLLVSGPAAVENRDEDNLDAGGAAVEMEDGEVLGALCLLVSSSCFCLHTLARRASSSARLRLRSRASVLAALPRPIALCACACVGECVCLCVLRGYKKEGKMTK